MGDLRQHGTDPESVVRAIADVAQKAAKAGKIKSIKLKIKLGSRQKKTRTADLHR